MGQGAVPGKSYYLSQSHLIRKVSAILEDLHLEQNEYAEYLVGIQVNIQSLHSHFIWQAIGPIIRTEQGDAIGISAIFHAQVFGDFGRPCS